MVVCGQNVSGQRGGGSLAIKKVVMSTGAGTVDVHQLASAIKNRLESILVIDSRSFFEHNACHIASAVNVCCSKIVKKRLQQDKLSVKELLHTCHCDVTENLDVVVYDQSSKHFEGLSAESFTVIILKKLQLTFHSVNLLIGGFEEFHNFYPDLCEDKTRKCAPLTSLSQPCLPVVNQGPTRILPFLYLGSQMDALNKEMLRDHNITYELNVSTSCPQPDFVPEGHFFRIAVNDTYSEKLLPYFPAAFDFLDKVRESSGCVLVHCLAGISRSPTIAIAYVMRYLHLSSDDGYRYVKSKRPTISPNFNFLGQLLEYEKQLRKENMLDGHTEVTSAPPVCSKKRVCRTDMRTAKLTLDIDLKKNQEFCHSGDQSPTTALAKLSFDVRKCKEESPPDFRQFRSKSCYGDWLMRDEERKTKELTQSKVLSPVKEIKCDGLIVDISTGANLNNEKSRERYCSFREADQRFSFSSKVKKKEQPRAKTIKDFDWRSLEDRKESLSLCNLSADRSREESYRTKPSQPFSFRSELRSYSSGFESESSHYIDKGKHLRLDIEFEDLEDDMVCRSKDLSVKNPQERRTFSLLSLPDVAVSEYPSNLRSPLSPSEKHLLEDLEVEKDIPKRDILTIDDSDGFHDSGIPLSPMSVLSRKRVADSSTENRAASRDKRKFESEPAPCNQTKIRTLWFPESSSHSFKGAYQSCDSGDKMGLYRVQSCPGILSSICALMDESKKYSPQKYFSKDAYSSSGAQEIMSHESCPDVLHLADIERSSNIQSLRQKDFRRNVRFIQVSY